MTTPPDTAESEVRSPFLSTWPLTILAHNAAQTAELEMSVSEYKPYVIDTGYLLPPSQADLLGADDDVHVFREVTDLLDIGSLTPTSAAWDSTLIIPECCSGF